MSLNSLGSLLFGDHRSGVIGRIEMSHFGALRHRLYHQAPLSPGALGSFPLFSCSYGFLHPVTWSDSEILQVDFFHPSLKIFCAAGKVGSNSFIYQAAVCWLLLRMERCRFHHTDGSRAADGGGAAHHWVQHSPAFSSPRDQAAARSLCKHSVCV